MAQPNTALRAIRAAHYWSQDDLARAVREAGERAGEPNQCDKRLVQRWEAGLVRQPRGAYARALEAATGQPLENLGFTPADERYGLDRGQALDMAAEPMPEPKGVPAGPLSGIWRSWYEYESSGRGQTYTSQHYGVILHRGARVQFRSLPRTAQGRVMMDLTINGQIVTGTWTEQTDAGGYYQGSVYSGGIQFIVEPTGHRMNGKWVGFGREFDLNTGPWTLTLVSADTGQGAQEQYNRPVEGESA
jgi:transcriptional regulator with XRE-family HTH domain